MSFPVLNDALLYADFKNILLLDNLKKREMICYFQEVDRPKYIYI